MKKRLLSLLLVLAVVFSFSLSAFATDTGIDIIDDPLSYYFENQIWPPRRTLYETNAFPIILDSRCRNNGKSHTLGTFPYARARLQAPRWGCDGGPVRIVGPPRAVPPKGTLTLPFRQLIFGARLAGTEVKRGWRFSPCSKYYPGGVEICGAEKILPDLYFCDGQAIMSMKLTEGST